MSVVITDPDGVIEYVNPAFEAMSGYSREDAVGQTPRLWHSGVQTASFYQQLWDTIRAGRVFHAIITNRHKDGWLFEHEQTITPILGEDGDITQYVSTGRDVSAPVRAMQDRLQGELDREAVRVAAALHDELGQFLALAHMTLVDVSWRVPEAAAERLQDVRRYLDHIEERLRESAQGSKPRVVADLGVVDAIRLIAKAHERDHCVPVVVEAPANFRCPATVETLLYRVVHDALVEVATLPDVSRVSIAIAREVGGRRAGDHVLRCTIACERASIVKPADVERFTEGLWLLQTQLAAIGGSLTAAPVGKSTVLHVTMPFSG
jgi:PAS domain S-box-containing protein